jgi:TetR/AcrR family transcriptional regulator, copper-responsive repressor
MREFAILPDEAYSVVTENRSLLEHLLAMNIEVEKPEMAPSAIAKMVLSFFPTWDDTRVIRMLISQTRDFH